MNQSKLIQIAHYPSHVVICPSRRGGRFIIAVVMTKTAGNGLLYFRICFFFSSS